MPKTKPALYVVVSKHGPMQMVSSREDGEKFCLIDDGSVATAMPLSVAQQAVKENYSRLKKEEEGCKDKEPYRIVRLSETPVEFLTSEGEQPPYEVVDGHLRIFDIDAVLPDPIIRAFVLKAIDQLEQAKAAVNALRPTYEERLRLQEEYDNRFFRDSNLFDEDEEDDDDPSD